MRREGNRSRSSTRVKRGPKLAALAVSLLLSAVLMGIVVRSDTHAWLAWISLVPLFAAVRLLRPVGAAVAGALWGGSFYFLCATGTAPAIPPALTSFALLAAIPALYAGLGSLATRAIGFSPLILGLGWVLVEVGLKPLGLHHGLLAGTQLAVAQTEPTYLDGLARILGYIVVAFLVASANASLLVVLSGVRLKIPEFRSIVGLPESRLAPAWRTAFCVQLLPPRQTYPRAPPMQ